MQNPKILWADDEIDLLKPHILFLESKGYDITAVNSGSDALEEVDHGHFELVFLDEHMPGMSGLETLNYIKSTHPNLPVVMITKNEEETIMEEAIGSKISDYLIKPVNPNQILLSAKKILDNKRLISERTNLGYQREFQELSLAVNDVDDHKGWSEIYRKLVFWDLQIENTQDQSMAEVLEMQWVEANDRFSHFIENEYAGWLNEPSNGNPLLSHEVLADRVFPFLSEVPTFLFVIDNLRMDQWKILADELAPLFNINEEQTYYSLLPTTTHYCRNALFAGLTPLEISQQDTAFWVGEDSDEPKNGFEKELIGRNLEREGLNIRYSYHKILRAHQSKQIIQQVNDLMSYALNVLVYNFVDMLSHARTDMQMIRELAPDESAYRSLTRSWFLHSSLYQLMKKLAVRNVKIIITTDHGTVRVKNPVKIIGDRETNTNLRYKQGKNLNYRPSKAFAISDPGVIGLPKSNVSTSFAFARNADYFVYPNNYNQFVRHFKNTFQHGGISMEEMILPFVVLTPR